MIWLEPPGWMYLWELVGQSEKYLTVEQPAAESGVRSRPCNHRHHLFVARVLEVTALAGLLLSLCC